MSSSTHRSGAKTSPIQPHVDGQYRPPDADLQYSGTQEINLKYQNPEDETEMPRKDRKMSLPPERVAELHRHASSTSAGGVPVVPVAGDGGAEMQHPSLCRQVHVVRSPTTGAYRYWMVPAQGVEEGVSGSDTHSQQEDQRGQTDTGHDVARNGYGFKDDHEHIHTDWPSPHHQQQHRYQRAHQDRATHGSRHRQGQGQGYGQGRRYRPGHDRQYAIAHPPPGKGHSSMTSQDARVDSSGVGARHGSIELSGQRRASWSSPPPAPPLPSLGSSLGSFGAAVASAALASAVEVGVSGSIRGSGNGSAEDTLGRSMGSMGSTITGSVCASLLTEEPSEAGVGAAANRVGGGMGLGATGIPTEMLWRMANERLSSTQSLSSPVSAVHTPQPHGQSLPPSAMQDMEDDGAMHRDGISVTFPPLATLYPGGQGSYWGQGVGGATGSFTAYEVAARVAAAVAMAGGAAAFLYGFNPFAPMPMHMHMPMRTFVDVPWPMSMPMCMPVPSGGGGNMLYRADTPDAVQFLPHQQHTVEQSQAQLGGAALPRGFVRQQRANRYRTKLCVFWLNQGPAAVPGRTGTCPYGDRCFYAHGHSELRVEEPVGVVRAGPRSMPQSARHTLSRGTPCPAPASGHVHEAPAEGEGEGPRSSELTPQCPPCGPPAAAARSDIGTDNSTRLSGTPAENTTTSQGAREGRWGQGKGQDRSRKLCHAWVAGCGAPGSCHAGRDCPFAHDALVNTSVGVMKAASAARLAHQNSAQE